MLYNILWSIRKNITDNIDEGIIPAVNQGRKQECAFLVAKEYYIAVDECNVNTNGYICQKKGNIYTFILYEKNISKFLLPSMIHR